MKHFVIEGFPCFACNKDCILRLSVIVLQNKQNVASLGIGLGCYILIVIIVGLFPSYPVLSTIMVIKEYTSSDAPPPLNLRV